MRYMYRNGQPKDKVIYIIRGLPGSGKSSLGKKLSNVVRAADDFFMVDGEYMFDPKLLGQAHAACFNNVENDLKTTGTAVVANTFTMRWEMEPYLQLADNEDARVVVIDTFDAGKSDEELARLNEHGVPAKSIAAMRARYEHNWRAGDPRPPWTR